ncbi:hypothetical protein FNU79_03990 [Deinococcus detaillensis]|uniref:Uncharacterized protein n=1 Tax=Deinococcus detaillensis TaxID=2592048 RepID=A0A553V5C1_9DEIO|nr:hypothetical protein [Deinococcus detaillensis]TSA87642.1 hypothetical protein FNU79_03990 [Deinococcus detaillensis]
MSASNAGSAARKAYGSETAAPLYYGGAQLRSADPLAQLSRRLNSACVRAVHPYELAAILESEGFTDALIQERFGDANVFACAERLFQLVPYRPAQPIWLLPQANRPLWRDLMRGLIYLLPAAWSPAALQLGWGEGASLGLLLASLFGWGWMQSVAYLGYFSLAAGQNEARAMLRRAGSAAVILSGLLGAAVALATGHNVLTVTLVTLAIAIYLAAATALLVLERETWLLLSLLPALLLSFFSALNPDWLSVSWLGAAPGFGVAIQAASVLLLAVGLPLLAAWHATCPPLFSNSGLTPRAAGGPSLRQIVASLPYGVYGWLCAAFLSLVLLSAGSASQASGAGLLGWSWSVVPLVLSMGVLERTLRRIQQMLRSQATRSSSLPSIIWNGFSGVLGWGAGYLCLLLLGYLLLGVLLPGAALPSELLAGHLALAAALLLSGLLINFGLLPRVLLVWGASLLTQLGLRALGEGVSGSYALSAGLCTALLLLGTWAAVRDLRHFQ